MGVQLRIRLAHHVVRRGAGLEDEHGVHAFFAADRQADHRRITNAAGPIEDALDILGKHVQPFRRDDHFLLAAADVDLAVGAEFADIAGVEPAVRERAGGFLVGLEISARDVLSAHQNLAVGGDLHLDSGNGLADRSLFRAERVIEADDRRRFGEPVPLNDNEAELLPERFELAIKRRRADDERPEFQAEEPVHAPVLPPASRHVLSARAMDVCGPVPQHVLAQHVEDLRHRHQDRHAPALDLRDDVDRVVAAHEHDNAGQHRRHERGHGDAEHVAEGQQVEKPQRKERPPPLAVFRDLPFDWHRVGEDVAVGDDHAFRFGGRARGEDDLCHVVAPDGDRRWRGVAPVEIVQRPDERVGRRHQCRHVLADQDHACRDDPPDADEEVGRGSVVDRNHDDAGEQTAPERDDPFGTVFAPDNNRVALVHAGRVQARGESTRRRTDLLVGIGTRSEAVIVDEEVAARARKVAKEVDQRVADH